MDNDLKVSAEEWFDPHDGRHPLAYMYEPLMQKVEYELAGELASTCS